MKVKSLVIVLAVIALTLVTITSAQQNNSSCHQQNLAVDANKPGDANKPAEPNKPQEPNKTTICASDFGTLADADKGKAKEPNKPEPNKPAEPNKTARGELSRTALCAANMEADKAKCDKDPNKDPNKPQDPNCKK
jgi:hypothetical protein